MIIKTPVIYQCYVSVSKLKYCPDNASCFADIQFIELVTITIQLIIKC